MCSIHSTGSYSHVFHLFHWITQPCVPSIPLDHTAMCSIHSTGSHSHVFHPFHWITQPSVPSIPLDHTAMCSIQSTGSHSHVFHLSHWITQPCVPTIPLDHTAMCSNHSTGSHSHVFHPFHWITQPCVPSNPLDHTAMCSIHSIGFSEMTESEDKCLLDWLCEAGWKDSWNPFYKVLMSSWLKSCRIFVGLNFNFNDPISLQFCIYHVVAACKIMIWILNFCVKAVCMFTKPGIWAHNYLVKWSPGIYRHPQKWKIQGYMLLIEFSHLLISPFQEWYRYCSPVYISCSYLTGVTAA